MHFGELAHECVRAYDTVRNLRAALHKTSVLQYCHRPDNCPMANVDIFTNPTGCLELRVRRDSRMQPDPDSRLHFVQSDAVRRCCAWNLLLNTNEPRSVAVKQRKTVKSRKVIH